MDDKNLMESLLLTTKGVGDLYLHGSIESSTAKVRGVFDSSLTRTLQMQKEIYDKMKEKGWYSPEMAQQDKVNQLKQKFSVN
jgi:spore coat protein CotF